MVLAKSIHVSEDPDVPVPDALVYEVMAGQPIYYHDMQDVLQGTQSPEAAMGSSYIQSFVISAIFQYLVQHLPEHFRVLTNELGLKLKENTWLAADIAVYAMEQLQEAPLHNHYLEIPPRVIIEVDTKADLGQFATGMDYYTAKTDALLAFGVQRVIWVFTDTRKIMVAEPNRDWTIQDWSRPLAVMDEITLQIANLVDEQTRFVNR